MIRGASLLLLLLLISECDGFVWFPHRVPKLSSNRGRSKTVQFLKAKPSPPDIQPQAVIQEEVSLDRLYPDSQSLIDWVEDHGGEFKADIALEKEGWSLASQSDIPANTALIRIPKKLCIFSDDISSASSLLEGTSALMGSLQTSQWRARLAIAVMSERVRPNSFFFPYLRNLPVDFLGIPLFYTEAELMQTQEPGVMHRAVERARFLSKSLYTAVTSLQKTPLDPFSGNEITFDHLVWGFAAASSRALRNIQSAGEYASSFGVIDNSDMKAAVELRKQSSDREKRSKNDADKPPQQTTYTNTLGPVMVPAIDLAAHSLTPSCAVRDAGDAFVLYTLRAVKAGEALTIHYGALSNDELLDDYGFTVDNNPFDTVLLDFDRVMLNAARRVVGQSDFASFGANRMTSEQRDSVVESDGVNWVPGDEIVFDITTPSSPEDSTSMVVASGDSKRRALARKTARSKQQVLRDDTLEEWQRVWLSCLGLQNVLAGSVRMQMGCFLPPSKGTISRDTLKQTMAENKLVKKYNPEVDPRLLALLRILYSGKESDLLSRGFDPFLLQHPGSLLSTPQEAQVVRTLLGVLSIIARYHDTTLAQDLRLLKESIAPGEVAVREDGADRQEATTPAKATAENIVTECRSILRSVLQANHLARTTDTSSEEKQLKNIDFNVSLEPQVDLMKFNTKRGRPSKSNQLAELETACYTAPHNAENNFVVPTQQLPGQALLSSLRRNAAQPDLVFMRKASLVQSKVSDAMSNNEDELVDFAKMRCWGEKLPVNIREAYKYRIRRKKLVWDIMVKCVEKYELLAQQSGASIPATSQIENKNEIESEVTDLALALSGRAASSSSQSNRDGNSVRVKQNSVSSRRPEEPALTKLRQLSVQWASHSNL